MLHLKHLAGKFNKTECVKVNFSIKSCTGNNILVNNLDIFIWKELFHIYFCLMLEDYVSLVQSKVIELYSTYIYRNRLQSEIINQIHILVFFLHLEIERLVHLSVPKNVGITPKFYFTFPLVSANSKQYFKCLLKGLISNNALVH